MMEDRDDEKEISAELGSLSLRVQGTDEEWVSETFDEKLEAMLSEAEDMTQAMRDGQRWH